MKTPFKLLFAVVSCLLMMTACNNDDDPVTPQPDTPQLTTLAVTGITSNSAQTGGNITDDRGALVSSRGVVWSTEQAPTLESHLGLTVDGAGLGVFTSAISGLNEGLSYYVRAYATNSRGTAYGEGIEFSTFTDLPSVITLDVINIGQTGAQSGGEISHQGNSPVTARGIVWGTEETPTTEINLGITSEGAGTGSFASALTGLSGNQTYYVRAYAINDAGINYGQTIEFTTFCNAFNDYQSNASHCIPCGTEVIEVINPQTGRTWMDRHLGASQAATSMTDQAAFGDYYQWGRFSDGHQCLSSPTTNTLSAGDTPGHGSFIVVSDPPNDWRSSLNNDLWQGVNGTNNPCPTGFRIPTESEWNAERLTWSSNNSQGAFESALKLPLPGLRFYFTGGLEDDEIRSRCWSSTISGSLAVQIHIGYSTVSTSPASRGNGHSVRCIKD